MVLTVTLPCARVRKGVYRGWKGVTSGTEISDNPCLFAGKYVSLYGKNEKLAMKDKINLNNYRLTGLEEPSDELLAALMKEVAEEAVRKRRQARSEYFKHLRDYSDERMKAWKDRIEQAKADVYEQ